MAEKIVVKDCEIQKGDFKFCEELEKGNILFFPKIPFAFPQEEIDFLLQQNQGKATGRKNIAYKPQLDQVTNHNSFSPEDAKKIHEVLRDYSRRVTDFLATLLAPYAKQWKPDYASFRPFQEKGRKLRLRARNDLLHVDAFPTRPVFGNRILRFFTNINPTESRQWSTAEPFADLVKKYMGTRGLDIPRGIEMGLKAQFKKMVVQWMHKAGWKGLDRSPYDHFMLKMHHFLKENEDFQNHCLKTNWDFPPNSCWAVFTDQVSHAALSGQYALEQTFFVPQRALLYPEKSPLGILEGVTGRNMV